MDVLVRAHRHTTDDESDFVRLMMELISDIQDVDAGVGPNNETEGLDELVDAAVDLQCELEEVQQDLVEVQESVEDGDDDDGEGAEAIAKLELRITELGSELLAQPAVVGG